MKPRPALVLLSAMFLAACTRPPAPVSPVATASPIAVLPPNNRTGDDLLVAGGSFLEKYAFHTERLTVSDVLATEARWQLERRGYTVVPAETVGAALGAQRPESAPEAAALAVRQHINASVLYIEIRRWEPDGHFNPDFVIVSIELTLLDPATGRVLWTANHPSRPVPTPGVVNSGQAYVIAAAKVMEETLAGLAAVQAGQGRDTP